MRYPLNVAMHNAIVNMSDFARHGVQVSEGHQPEDFRLAIQVQRTRK